VTLRGQHVAVGATCLVAAVSYAGTVTTWALGWFVLPGAVGAALVGALLGARRLSTAALIVGGLLVLGWSELANVVTGLTNGPAARSTFAAAGCSLVAAVVAQSRYAAFFLAAVAGVVAGALILGTGGEVPVVAVATAVCAALTLGSIEAAHRNWTVRPRRSPALVLVALLVGAVAIGVVLVLKQSDPRQPEVLGPGRAYPAIKPAWTDPLATTRPAQPQQETRPATHRSSGSRARPSTASVKPRSASARKQDTSRSKTWLYALAAFVLILLGIALLAAARLLAVRVAWRRLRRRLATGTPAERVTGAWAWARLRLEACHLPLAVAVSPDTLADDESMGGLPTDIFRPMHALGRAATSAAFSHGQSVRAGDAAAAWRAAGRAETSARDLLTRRSRVALAFRRPAADGRAR